MQVSPDAAKFAAQDARFDASLQDTQEVTQKDKAALTAVQQDSENSLEDETEMATMGAKAENVKMKGAESSKKIEKAKDVQESVLVRPEDADGFAQDFSNQGNNQKYRLEANQLSQLAQSLGKEISEEAPPQKIIEYVTDRLRSSRDQSPDVSQVDKGFEFLLYVLEQQKGKAAPGTPENDRLTKIESQVRLAKNEHYEINAKAIDTAREIIGVASGMSEKLDASVKETLDALRDIIDNPQDVQTKRKHYQQHGGYPAMLSDSQKIFHVIGDEIKQVNINIDGKRTTKPVIDNPKMSLLMSEVKTMQACIRVPLIAKVQERIIFKRMMKAGVISAAAAQ